MSTPTTTKRNPAFTGVLRTVRETPGQQEQAAEAVETNQCSIPRIVGNLKILLSDDALLDLLELPAYFPEMKDERYPLLVSLVECALLPAFQNEAPVSVCVSALDVEAVLHIPEGETPSRALAHAEGRINREWKDMARICFKEANPSEFSVTFAFI